MFLQPGLKMRYLKGIHFDNSCWKVNLIFHLYYCWRHNLHFLETLLILRQREEFSLCDKCFLIKGAKLKKKEFNNSKLLQFGNHSSHPSPQPTKVKETWNLKILNSHLERGQKISIFRLGFRGRSSIPVLNTPRV